VGRNLIARVIFEPGGSPGGRLPGARESGQITRHGSFARAPTGGGTGRGRNIRGGDSRSAGRGGDHGAHTYEGRWGGTEASGGGGTAGGGRLLRPWGGGGPFHLSRRRPAKVGGPYDRNLSRFFPTWGGCPHAGITTTIDAAGAGVGSITRGYTPRGPPNTVSRGQGGAPKPSILGGCRGRDRRQPPARFTGRVVASRPWLHQPADRSGGALMGPRGLHSTSTAGGGRGVGGCLHPVGGRGGGKGGRSERA